jgi:hypothetical protein
MGRFAVVDMGNNGKVADMGKISHRADGAMMPTKPKKCAATAISWVLV